MLIIPLGSDHKRARFPRLTVTLILACSVIYIVFFWAEQVHWAISYPKAEKLSSVEYQLMLKYLADQGEENPGKALAWKDRNPLEYYEFEKKFHEDLKSGKVVPPESPLYIEWDKAFHDFELARRHDPSYIFGYVPADPGPVSIFTHMFLHADFWHLFWNMLFLWLAGANLEDVWSRKYYMIVYLAGGVVAAFTHQLLHLASYVPMIGASGAIAALMGAYAVRFARNKLMFGLFTWFWWVPAWIPLLLWFSRQLYYGILYWGQDVGVGIWAHIGGFAFGAAAAFTLRRFKAEESFIAQSLTEQDKKDQARARDKELKKALQAGPVRSEELSQAITARQHGRYDEAEERFRAALQKNPLDFEARDEFIRFYMMRERPREAAREMGAMIEASQRAGRRDQALAWYREICRLGFYADAAGPWLFGIAREMESLGDSPAAAANYQNFARACQGDPRAPKSLFLAASILEGKLSRPAEALAILDQIRSAFPEWMPDQVASLRDSARKKAGA